MNELHYYESSSKEGTLAVLRGARNLISKGWTRFMPKRQVADQYGKYGMAYCSVGATQQAWIDLQGCAVSGDQRWADRLLTEVVREQYPDHDASIPNWNDHLAKNKDEVLAFFDKAITRLEEQV